AVPAVGARRAVRHGDVPAAERRIARVVGADAAVVAVLGLAELRAAVAADGRSERVALLRILDDAVAACRTWVEAEHRHAGCRARRARGKGRSRRHEAGDD